MFGNERSAHIPVHSDERTSFAARHIVTHPGHTGHRTVRPSPTHAEITFALGSDRNGKAQITMMYKNGAEVAMLLD